MLRTVKAEAQKCTKVDIDNYPNLMPLNLNGLLSYKMRL